MKQNNTKITPKEESLIVQLVAKYMPYWPLFAILMIITMISSIGYIRYTSPKFMATASLIIKDEKKGNEESKFLESLNMINAKKIIENEVEVLKSRPVIDAVVKKLRLYAPIYIEGKILDLNVYDNQPFTIEIENIEKTKETKENIYLSFDKTMQRIYLNNKYVGNAGNPLKTKYGVITFINNPSYKKIQSKFGYYFKIITIRNQTKNILNNLKVNSTNKLSSVVELQYKDYTPKLSEDVLNEIIHSYNYSAINEKNITAKNTLKFIEERLNIVGGELAVIEKKIQQYKANSGAVDISTQGQLFLQNVSANDQKLSDLTLQISVMNQLEKQLSDNNNYTGMMSSPIGNIDPSITQLLGNLNTAELEREKMKKTVAENNPILISLSDQIIKIKQDIYSNIKTQRKNLESNKQNLFQTNSNYNNMLHNIPVKERELLEISREQNIKNGIYSFLLQKREESELSYASTISDSRTINYAQSTNNPVSPNKLFILGIAMVAVLGIPISIIGAKETFNTTILYRQEIESLTSIPIIGEVEYNNKKEMLAIETGKRSNVAEEFRKIRYTLQHLGINAEKKKILITSSISGEGKSFVSANLAISYSMTGKNVILIDLDLHNSSLDKIFGTETKKGISEYLSNEAKELEIINKVERYEHLSFIASGGIKDDPSELLTEKKILRLLTYLENKYDVIIIDTAPVVLITDANLLSAYCDMTLYVVRHKYSPKIILKRFDINNDFSPLKNPYIIFNGIKKRGFSKHDRGYGYGYAYGEKRNDKKI
jgi:tyrosine-protein kinase Etk/Wzc